MAAIIKTVIVKDDLPSVEQARAKLQSELQIAQQSGVKVLKVVHGYGSSGVGGDLRIALQSTLRQMVSRREIRECIYGENWRKSDERSWELLKHMPELKNDSDLGKGNKGITLVVLWTFQQRPPDIIFFAFLNPWPRLPSLRSQSLKLRSRSSPRRAARWPRAFWPASAPT